MQFTRVAPITLSQNERQVSARCHQAIASEPSTPQAAHSVAVAQPTSRETNTRVMRSMRGMSCADLRSFSANDMGGSAGGVRCGLASDQTAM